MSSAPSTQQTATRLAALTTNERIWFWLCPTGSPALLVQPFASEKPMDALKASIMKVKRPKGAVQFLGMGAFGEDGRMRLTGKTLKPAALTGLAEWVNSQVDDHPDLGRLRDAMLMPVSSKGQVGEAIEDASLWKRPAEAPAAEEAPAEEAAPPAPGSLAEAAGHLTEVMGQGQAWMWLSESGPDGGPAMVVMSNAEDPRGAAFAGKVKSMIQRTPKRGRMVSGLFRAHRSGTRMVLSRGDINITDMVRAAVVGDQSALLSVLAGSWLLQAAKARPTAVRPPMGGEITEDLSAQEMVLDLLEPGKSAWFWFHSAGHLELATDRGALRPKIKELKAKLGEGQSGMGRIKNRKGWVEFQLKEDFPGFIPALAQWVIPRVGSCASLRKLSGARMVVLSKDGEVVERQRNDSVWMALE